MKPNTLFSGLTLKEGVKKNKWSMAHARQRRATGSDTFTSFFQLAYLAQTLKRQLRDAFGSKVIQK